MTITLVTGQATGADGALAVSVSKAYPGNVTSGNRIVIAGWGYQAGTGAPVHTWVAGDCTKTSGTATLGTITLDKVPTIFSYSANNNLSLGIWSAPVTGTGSCTMQIAGLRADGNSVIAMAIGEWHSDLGSITVSGITNNADSTSGSLAVNSGNVTTATGVGSLIIGVACDPDDPNNTNQGYTAGNSFANMFSVVNGSGTSLPGAGAYRIVTSATTTAAAWTLTGSSRWFAAASCYQEPSGGGGGGRAISQQTPMNGVGVGGPFFSNPIGCMGHSFARAANSDLFIPKRMRA